MGIIQAVPEFENNILPPDNPPTSFQVVDNIEIVQEAFELEDSASFLDNPQSEQIVETGEIVQMNLNVRRVAVTRSMKLCSLQLKII